MRHHGERDRGRAAARARAAALAATLTVPQQIGQLLVAGVPGTSAADGGAALVRDYHLGGVIYFGRNIRTAAQAAELSNGLQRAALAQPPGIPLLIGTDEEGGSVSRLAGLAPGFPDQMAAGAAGDPALVRAQQQAAGGRLRALGITVAYAPVADVNSNPANPVIGIRSFGSDPGLVAELTAAAVAGLHAAGTAAVAKHFPGHGDTSVDSHTGLPVICHSRRQWQETGLPPFRAAIRAGVDAVMTGHLAVPALDGSGGPASLSRAVTTGLLRRELGFPGVIVTDSLRMAGVAAGGSAGEIAVRAVAAGADQLLMPADLPAAYAALLAAVHGGRITTARLAASVRRVLALKLSLGLPDSPLVSAADAEARMRHGQRTAAELARRSVTLVFARAAAGRPVLPLAGRSVHVAGPMAARLAPELAAALARGGGRLAGDPAAADVTVVATRDAVADPAQRELAARLVGAGQAGAGPPVVVVATGLPYDLGLFPAAAAGLATYSAATVSLAAAAAALTGEISPGGRLPAAIPGPGGGIAWPRGTGLGC